MIIFIAILSILILIHELGHFLVAKRRGIRVEKFSLGFGPKLVSKKIGPTEYMLCLVPFGGFIKMAGDNKEECKGAPDEFLSRPPGQRAQVIFAGPFFNYVLAFFCLWMVFYLGYPKFSSTVGELMPGMPAARAGLQAGDTITSVDGEPVQFWDEMTRRIHAKKGEDVQLKVKRDGREFDLLLTPEAKEVETIWGRKAEVGLIGIKPSDEIIKVRYGLWPSLIRGTQSLWEMTVMTVRALFYIIIGTMSFKDSVTGPLGIFFITTNAAKIGFSSILHVIGILSMSLAIFNLLPLPILDGGHIFFAGLEKLRGRPLASKTEDVVSNIGMGFLIVLAIFIFCNDLIRYGYWDKFLALFQK
ncbi:MAG: RIP metalloprotease RseP [Candidatus Omnitrophica bacterium]|nr:RIP metalloprotease RseP [Candidatus Omnitrophota bacterium]MDD5574148.1 RIP metalloprotease RseP [Candidatus Omnitrophota bacterium]